MGKFFEDHSDEIGCLMPILLLLVGLMLVGIGTYNGPNSVVGDVGFGLICVAVIWLWARN